MTIELCFRLSVLSACSRMCQNGGTLDTETCMCDCAGGFSGANYESERSFCYAFWVSEIHMVAKQPRMMSVLMMERLLCWTHWVYEGWMCTEETSCLCPVCRWTMSQMERTDTHTHTHTCTCTCNYQPELAGQFRVWASRRQQGWQSHCNLAVEHQLYLCSSMVPECSEYSSMGLRDSWHERSGVRPSVSASEYPSRTLGHKIPHLDAWPHTHTHIHTCMLAHACMHCIG